MSCLSVDTLEDLLNSQLTDAQRQEVVPHLSECSRCSKLVADLLASRPHAPVEARRALAKGDLLGRYVILEAIGHGAMGIVYRALDPLLERHVAVKTLNEDAVIEGAQLVEEARVLARLAHPNVVQVYEAGTSGSVPFLVMQLVEGSTLSDWMAQPHPWREVVARFIEAGRGLAAAHDAGLVHGDFKPSNVLLNQQQVALVADFGLGRRVESQVRPPGRSGGTPAYMAPEVFAGERTNATSDQFSFFVALYEALFGWRPFAGNTSAELANEVFNGTIREAPRGSPVPAWLKRLLRRGLSPRPAARFASMREVVRRLERGVEVHSRSVKLALGAAGCALALASVWFVHVWRTSCADDGSMATAWNPTVQRQLAQTFERTGAPFARTTFDAVRAQLERYVAEWNATNQAVCEASRFGGQHPRLSTLEQTCLSNRRETLRAFLESLAHADPQLVASSVYGVAALPPIAACTDLERLQLPTALPASPALREQVKQSRALSSRASVLTEAGLNAEAQLVSTQALALATDAGYGPAIAEAELQLGLALPPTGERAAVAHLKEAIWVATASNHPEVLARAATTLTGVLAGASQLEPANDWRRLAEATLARLGKPPALQGELERTWGLLNFAENDYPRAIAHDREALRLLTTASGETSPATLTTRMQLADALRRHGEYELAMHEAQAVLQTVEATWGADHPWAAQVLTVVANDETALGHYEKAAELFQRASDLFLRTRGKNSLDRCGPLLSLGGMQVALTRFDQALATYDELLRILRLQMPESDPRLLTSRGKRADALDGLGRKADALRELEDVIEKLGPVDAAGQYLSSMLTSAGNLQLALGKPREALATFRRQLALDEARVGPTHPEVVWGLNGIGMALQRLNQWNESIGPLRRALKVGLATKYHPDLLAYTQLYLAKALLRSGGHRDEGRSLARDAEAGFAQFPGETDRREEARALLRGQPVH